jgi:hypothetical protein
VYFFSQSTRTASFSQSVKLSWVCNPTGPVKYTALLFGIGLILLRSPIIGDILNIINKLGSINIIDT